MGDITEVGPHWSSDRCPHWEKGIAKPGEGKRGESHENDSGLEKISCSLEKAEELCRVYPEERGQADDTA